jgi:sugar phosphate isomerase/epimerase
MIPIALQLYAVREECAKDFAGTLSAVAEMGYAGVEFAGNYGRTAAELRGMIAERGLQCAGTHTQLSALMTDELVRTVDFNLALGNKHVVVPSLPAERRASRVAWLDSARLFDEIAAKLEPHGLRLGYHNHRAEFQAVDGELPWHLIFDHVRPSVITQLDVGHALEAGADPVAELRRYAGRATTVHMAEWSAAEPLALLGEGDVPWRAVLTACESVGGTQWYIVEQETYRYSQLECARRCLANLKQLQGQR